MNIILLERIEKLGQMGELVSVKSGYARNYLLPHGKAVLRHRKTLNYLKNEKHNLKAKTSLKKMRPKN